MIWLNNLISFILPLVPKSLVKIVAKQYIAGETLEQAVVKAKQLNRDRHPGYSGQCRKSA